MEPHPPLFITYFRSHILKSASRLFTFTLNFLHVLEMFSFTRMISSVSAALALASVSSVLAVPIQHQRDVSPLLARATAPSPAFVIYTAKFVSANVLPDVSQLAVSFLFGLCFCCFTH